MKKIYPLLLLLLLFSCSKDQVQPISVNDDQEKLLLPLSFSGYQWTIKNSGTSRIGPGGNYFSKKPANVFIDAFGNLHLAITKKNNKWSCAEVWSNKSFGYGRYIFVTKGNVEQYDKNIVVGLFTWDDNTHQSAAHDELDVEFSKWGSENNQHVMEYSVQPTYGIGAYPERTNIPQTSLVYDENGFTTHVIDWRSDRVKFETHTGDDTTASTLTQSWTFDDTNPARQANDEGLSDPIVIPLPGATTKAHINFWLFDANGNGKGDAPSNGFNAELVVKRFQFIAQ